MAAKRYCELCGGPIRPDNRVGICRRTPECHAAAERASRFARRHGGRRPVLTIGNFCDPVDSPVSEHVAPAAVVMRATIRHSGDEQKEHR